MLIAPILIGAAPAPVTQTLPSDMSIKTTQRPDPLAPMPNRDIAPPSAPSEDGISLSPSLYPRDRFTTDPTAPRTTRTPLEQPLRNQFTPGLNLKVPLQ